jgi:hypothetical protein
MERIKTTMLSRRQIVKRIRDLQRRRQPLNISAVQRYSPEVIESVYSRKKFWGWRRALEDAGISYGEINVEVLGYVNCQICGRDLAALGTHLAKIHQTNSQEYKEEFPGEFTVCESVRARLIGTCSELPHWEPIWSAEYALDRVAHVYQLGYAMNHLNIRDLDPGLTRAARDYHGGWDFALRKIGLEPLDHRLNNEIKWDKATIIEMIQERHRDGFPLTAGGAAEGTDNPYYKGTNLPHRALELFGTWEAALRAAGVEPEEVGSYYNVKKYPNAELALKEIKRRKRGGIALNHSSIANDDISLTIAGRKYFGSWPDALEAAGIDADSVNLHSLRIKYKTRADIVEELKRRVRQGLPVTHAKAQNDDPGLLNAVRRHFGRLERRAKSSRYQPG